LLLLHWLLQWLHWLQLLLLLLVQLIIHDRNQSSSLPAGQQAPPSSRAANLQPQHQAQKAQSSQLTAHSPKLTTSNRKLQTENSELQTANSELQTAHCRPSPIRRAGQPKRMLISGHLLAFLFSLSWPVCGEKVGRHSARSLDPTASRKEGRAKEEEEEWQKAKAKAKE